MTVRAAVRRRACVACRRAVSGFSIVDIATSSLSCQAAPTHQWSELSVTFPEPTPP